MSAMNENNRPETEDLREPTLREVTMSVLAAAIGVQSAKNRERDFTRGNPLVFVTAGLIFTVVFVLTLVGIVHLVL